MNVAAEWADAYFNADYHAAEALCTPDVETDDFFPEANDTLRVVMLKVHHYIRPALLGQTSRQEDEGLFRVTVVKRSNRWLVRMADLPRSEKQSRD